jgi:prepilin signal peptidase PulO-like enzyme (type II secretory pathway)
MEIGLVFILGLVMGSFFNVIGIRLLKGESLAFPPSHCTSCGHKLGPLDLIPVLSYIFLRGKCRYCKNQISPIYCIGELLTGITFAFLFWRFNLSVELLIHLVIGSMLVISVITDIQEKIVVNEVVLTALGLVLILRLLNWRDIAYYSMSAVGVFAFMYLLFVLSGEKIGGGDVKLYIVIALALGAWATFISLFYASTLALILIGPLMLMKKVRRNYEIPFVPFIWAGVILTYIWPIVVV